MNAVVATHALIEPLLAGWKPALGADHGPYRNHVYRVFHLATWLARAEGDDAEKLAIAAAFHDVGIWLDGTFDYLGPSSRRAIAHVTAVGRGEWADEIHDIIDQHHKLRRWRGPEPNLVEHFRQADWLDVCLFALPTRINKADLTELLRVFPRLGFHRRLVSLTLGWASRHPRNPLPIFKW